MYDLDAHIIDHEILGIHAGSGGGVSGTGTTNTIPMWTNGPGGVLGDSRITDDGTNIGISDATKFYVGRFSTSGLSADQLFTFPDSSGTIAVGAGTTYNIPFYTNGAEATLGDGPLSYDGSVFVNSIQPIKTIYGGAPHARWGFDATNFAQLTVSGVGAATFSLNGTFPQYIFDGQFTVKSDASSQFTMRRKAGTGTDGMDFAITSSGITSTITESAATATGWVIRPSALWAAGPFLNFQDYLGKSVFQIDAPTSAVAFGVATPSGTTMVEFGSAATAINNAFTTGVKFGPKWGTSIGTNLPGNLSFATDALISASFSSADNSAGTAKTLCGGLFTNQAIANRVHDNIIGAVFKPYDSTIAAGSPTAHGSLYGWWVRGVGTGKSTTATAIYGGRIDAMLTGATPGTTDAYGLYVEEQVQATNKYGLWLASGTAGYKAIAIRDANAWIGSSAAAQIDIGATNFKVQSANIGFFNHAVAAQPAAYTPSNVSADRSYDANSTTIDELADVLGTLIADLQTMGLVA